MEMKTTWTNMKWKVSVYQIIILATLTTIPDSVGSCPSVCSCKWKGGKQAVECLERALITVPENIDGETQVLDLSGNNLQIIPSETFYRANLTNLQKVYLRSCRIGQMGDRAFRGLTNLVELDLSFNLLTTVPSAAFEDSPFLRYLSLANNPIQKIESNAFRMVTGVAKIDLSHCEIQTIAPSAFEKLESLEWLKVNGNKLTELHPKTVETMRRLHGIELHDNPWVCDCKLRSVKEWLSHSNIPYPVDPACRKPERVSDTPFGELGIDDFACKPNILPASRYVEATTGENATISCRVGAMPSPDIHWYWSGRLLLNNSAFTAFQRILILEEGKYEKTSSLTLTNVFDSDSGEFHCVAENRAGTAEANFTLNVSMRSAKLAALTHGEIAGLGAALLTLVLTILIVALVLLLRFRRNHVSESKCSAKSDANDARTQTVQTVGGKILGTNDRCEWKKSSSNARKNSWNSSVSNESGLVSQVQQAGNNPDVVLGAKPFSHLPSLLLPPYLNSLVVDCSPAVSGGLGEQPRSALYDSHHTPSNLLESYGLYESGSATNFYRRNGSSSRQDQLDTPDQKSVNDFDLVDQDKSTFVRVNVHEYPPDYGLPIPDLRDHHHHPHHHHHRHSPPHVEMESERADRGGIQGIRLTGIPTDRSPSANVANAFHSMKTEHNALGDDYLEECGTDV